MTPPLIAGLPPDMAIGHGYIVSLTAVDAVSGNVIAGVSIAAASIFATHLGGPIDDLVPQPRLVPSSQIV